MELVRTLEERAFAAWPAEEVLTAGPWRLRHTRGVTRRANSVWVDGGGDLPALVAEAERFYQERGQPPLFQLSPLAPPALDPFLAERGYALDAPVVIAVAHADAVPAAPGAHLEPGLSPMWFTAAARGRFSAVPDVYRGILQRLGDRALYAMTGEGEAVGLGVVDGEWLGVFNMATAPDHRRRGWARAVLSALARAALARGARRLYLQVERDNAPARALYTQAGFADVYAYHYRVAPQSTVEGCR